MCIDDNALNCKSIYATLKSDNAVCADKLEVHVLTISQTHTRAHTHEHTHIHPPLPQIRPHTHTYTHTYTPTYTHTTHLQSVFKMAALQLAIMIGILTERRILACRRERLLSTIDY